MSRNPVENRPSTAQWLIRSREAAGFTNAEAFLAAVKKAEGAAPSYSTYAQWESGEVTPRTATIAPIVRYHAAREATSKPPAPPEPPPDPLATAIIAQAKAIQALADELQAWRTEDRTKLEKLGATVGLLAERVLAPRERRELVGLDAQQGSAG